MKKIKIALLSFLCVITLSVCAINKAPIASKNFPVFSRWTFYGNQNFGSSANDDQIAFSNTGIPYAEYTSETGLIDVMTLQKNIWTSLSSTPFSHKSNDNSTVLQVDNQGHPYVAYIHDGAITTTQLKEFNGTAWVSLGSPNSITDIESDDGILALAINGSGVPFVVYSYEDADDSLQLAVFKYDSDQWQQLTGLNATDIQMGGSVSMAIKKNGTVYVAYMTNVAGTGVDQIVVKKFNSETFAWQQVGNSFQTDGSTLSIALNSQGAPYILTGDQNGLMVFTLSDEDMWAQVGNNINVSFQREGDNGSLAIAPNGKIYVTYNNIYKNVVRLNNHNQWVSVGPANFVSAWNYINSLAFDENSNPYVIYTATVSGYANVLTFQK